MPAQPESSPLQIGLACKCPRCERGDLYKPGWTLDLRDSCVQCGLDFQKNDAADGPAFFLICFLGVLVVPLALLLDMLFHPPIWVHMVLWTIVALGVTLGALRPVKAFIMALQFRHRPTDWE